MSRIWMRRVTHKNTACHTCGWAPSHHLYECMNESCHVWPDMPCCYVWRNPFICETWHIHVCEIRLFSSIDDPRHPHEYMNKSCHTWWFVDWLINWFLNVWMSHVTHDDLLMDWFIDVYECMNKSCHAWCFIDWLINWFLWMCEWVMSHMMISKKSLVNPTKSRPNWMDDWFS